MEDNTNRLELIISVKDDGSVVIDTVKKKIDDVGQVTEQASAKGTSGLKAMKAGWLELAAGVTAGYFTIKKGIDVITNLVNVAAEAEQIEKRAAFQIETWGYKFQEVKPYVDAFAESIQRTTRFSGEMAQQGLGQMMQYTSNIEEAMKGVQIALNITTQTGKDFNSMIQLIGMAMNGNVEILGKWIPQLKNIEEKLGANATEAEKWAYTQGLLNKMFGGAAQADLEAYAGQLTQLKNQWDDLKRSMGTTLMPKAEDWVLGMKSCFADLSSQLESPFSFLNIIKRGMKDINAIDVGVPLIGAGKLLKALLQDVPKEEIDAYLNGLLKKIDDVEVARKKAAEQAAAIPKLGPAAPEKDWIKKWVADFDDLNYSYERLGIVSQKTLTENTAATLTYMESVKKAYQEGKASVSDYMNAIKAANDALKKVVGEDVTDKLVKNEEEYQKRVRAISPEDPERQKKVQATIDDWQKVRKEIEKMKIPIHADISPGEAEIREFIRKAEAQGINLKVNIESTGSPITGGGGGGGTSWMDYVKGNTEFFQGGKKAIDDMNDSFQDWSEQWGQGLDVPINIFGIGSSRKPITEKIREIIGEFGGLEKALSGMEAEINVAELSAEYKKLEAKLNQVERIIPDMSAMASWAGGSPYVGGPIIQTVTDLISEYTEQMKIITMKMDYERLRAYGGSYQAGTRYVPQTGLYTLHEGEKVTTKNQILMGGVTATFHIQSTDPKRTADEICKVLKYRLHGELNDLLKSK